MRFDVVTLFPEIFANLLATSFVARAVEGGQLAVRFRSPRQFGLGKHRSVDDTPYGGGSGMLLRVDVLVSTMESLDSDAPEGAKAHRVLLTPQGRVLDQRRVRELVGREAVMLVCGRFEGFDERVRAHVQEEISLGDFVMTGGEVAAMAIIDACTRLLPGVLGNRASTLEESHSPETGNLLEYPQYTRPAEFRGGRVPEILQSGHHGDIEAWRRAQAISRTQQRRPDLWERFQHDRGGARRRDGGGEK
jgi:tRNA (guanine37-N1)-methyltransferase